MKLYLYLENESLKDFLVNSDEEICNIIEEIDRVINSSMEAKDELKKRVDFYYSMLNDEMVLCDWLFDVSPEYSVLQNHKRIMMKFIEQCETVDNDTYNDVCNNIKTQNYDQPNAFISIMKDSETERHITNMDKWLKVHRFYLNVAENIDEFIDGIEHSFPNLYFHPYIKETMKTLNYPFTDYRDEIINHLEALNDVFPLIYEENKKEGYQSVSKKFAAITDIRCSPERKRQTAQNRVFNFVTETNEQIGVTCELHTKFTKFRKDKDRLYFHPGYEKINNNKILIAYIGEHLE